MDSQKRQAIVPFWSCQPISFFNSRPPVVHIQALFSPAAHHPKPPTPPLTRCISPVNPPRNVALVMERMPGACPAGAVASKRTGACRSASPAWTVDSSTGSRRATAPPPPTPCVVTVCQGERRNTNEPHTCIIYENYLTRMLWRGGETCYNKWFSEFVHVCNSWQLWRLKRVTLCLPQILQEN